MASISASQNAPPNMCVANTSVTCSAEDIDQLCKDLTAEDEYITEWLWQNKMRLDTGNM